MVGYRGGTSRRQLFVHCFQFELEICVAAFMVLSLFDHSYHLEILSLIFSKKKKKTLQNKHVKVIPEQDRYHTAHIFH